MDIDHLVRMANQIGRFFDSYPDRDEASTQIACHLQQFWAPRMRRELLEHVDRLHGDGLDASVLSSIATHRQRLAPKPQA